MTIIGFGLGFGFLHDCRCDATKQSMQKLNGVADLRQCQEYHLLICCVNKCRVFVTLEGLGFRVLGVLGF